MTNRGFIAVILIAAIITGALWFTFGRPSQQSAVQLSGIITFTDGSQKSFSTGSLSFFPMQLEAGDPIKVIASVTITVSVKPTYSGTMTSYSLSGSATLGRARIGAGDPAVIQTDPISNQGSAWASGESKDVFSKSYSASSMEAGLPIESDVSYIFRWAASVTFTATLSNKQDSLSGSNSVDIIALHSNAGLQGT